MEAVRTSET